MNPKAKTLMIFFIISGLIVLSYFAYSWLTKSFKPQNDLADAVKGTAAAQASASPKERKKAPDFTVLDNEGKRIKLSDFQGKPVVVNFWASWCSPCKSEMPDFDEVYQIAGGDVAFMMVNMTDGSRETQETAKEYISDMGFKFPVYFDVDQEAAYAYGVNTIPMSVFIDKDGYVVAYADGPIDKDTLLKGIGMINP